MNRKVLFLHIPKTAGSTLKTFLRARLDDFVLQANSADQLKDPSFVRVRDMDDVRTVLAKHGGLALHVDSNVDSVRRTTDFWSLSGLVFEPAHYRDFDRVTILTMLRHPFRRFVSEFGFLQRMKAADAGFLPDLDLSTPEAFLDRTHPNAMLHFLLERDLHRPRTMTGADLERVMDRMANHPIHVGIHERFDESVAYFGRVLGCQFQGSDLPALNVGREAPVVGAHVKAAFLERNGLDMALYDYAVRLFGERSPG